MSLTNLDIKNLKDKKYRQTNSLFLVEGEKFCYDLLNSNVEIVYTITTDKNLLNFPNIQLVNERQLIQLSSTKTPQSTVCVCRFKPPSVDSIGNCLILDNLQDPGNVGTLIRSALAFGFKDVYLVGGADPYSEKVIRSSAGTILKARIHITSFEEIKANKQKIADEFIVADMKGKNLNSIDLPKGKKAVIIGNEGQGVSNEFMSFANIKVAIPMSSEVESLNAGVAGSIIMQKIGENYVRS